MYACVFSFLALGLPATANILPETTPWGATQIDEGLDAAAVEQHFKNAAIKIRLGDQQLRIAASDAVVNPDGRLKFRDCLIVYCGKEADPPATGRSAAIRSKTAVLTLDVPVREFDDILARRVISVELANGTKLNLSK
jgi:hypothetical protein